MKKYYQAPLLLPESYQHKYKQPSDEDELNSCLSREEIEFWIPAFPTPVKTLLNSLVIDDKTFQEVSQDSALVQTANQHLSTPLASFYSPLDTLHSIYAAAMRDIRWVTTFNPIERKILRSVQAPSFFRKYKDKH